MLPNHPADQLPCHARCRRWRPVRSRCHQDPPYPSHKHAAPQRGRRSGAGPAALAVQRGGLAPGRAALVRRRCMVPWSLARLRRSDCGAAAVLPCLHGAVTPSVRRRADVGPCTESKYSVLSRSTTDRVSARRRLVGRELVRVVTSVENDHFWCKNIPCNRKPYFTPPPSF